MAGKLFLCDVLLKDVVNRTQQKMFQTYKKGINIIPAA